MRLPMSKWMLLLSLAGTAVGCQGSRAEVAPAELDGRTSIEIMVARKGVVREVGSYYGKVKARRSIMVSAEIGGTTRPGSGQ